MKKSYIFLITIGIILTISTVVGIVASQTELDTYISNVRLEATSGYPPHLTIIVDEGVVQETVLLSLLPKLNLPRLSTYVHTKMTGTIKIDCGEGVNETRNFNLVTDNPGDKMIQRFVFKGLPTEEVCFVVAQALTCETEQLTCKKNKINLMVRTP